MNENIRKAAIVVAGLDTPAADLVLGQITPEEADRVRRAIFELGPVTPEEERRAINEFLRLGGKPSAPRQFARDAAGRGSPTAGATATSGPPSPPATGKPAFDFLRQADAARLAGVLAGERPQVVAVVLSHLASETAAEVLVQFPPQTQSEIVRRLLDLEETDAGILEEIEAALRARLAQEFPLPRRRVAGIAAVAGILDAADRNVGKQLYDNIAAGDHRLAQRLQPALMGFDELVRLNETSLQTLVEVVDVKLLTLALVGTPAVVVDRVLGQLPATEAALVRSDLAHLGPTRLSDVQEARHRIAQLAQRLGLGHRRVSGGGASRVLQTV